MSQKILKNFVYSMGEENHQKLKNLADIDDELYVTITSRSPSIYSSMEDAITGGVITKKRLFINRYGDKYQFYFLDKRARLKEISREHYEMIVENAIIIKI